MIALEGKTGRFAATIASIHAAVQIRSSLPSCIATAVTSPKCETKLYCFAALFHSIYDHTLDTARVHRREVCYDR